MFSEQVHDTGVVIALQKTARLGPGDFRTAFRRISRAWLGFIHDGFLRERDPYGTPWKELHPATIVDKRARGSAHATDILRDTGAMAASFHAEVNRTGFAIFTDHVFDDGNTPEIHQFGGIGGGNNFIPARPMLPLDGFPPEWQQIAESYLGDDLDNIFRDATA